jgi:hypothetical protein
MIEIKINEIRRWRKTVRDAFTKYSVPVTDTTFVIIEAKIVESWSHKFSKSIPVQYYVVRYMPSGTIREYSEDVIRSHTRPAK